MTGVNDWKVVHDWKVVQDWQGWRGHMTQWITEQANCDKTNKETLFSYSSASSFHCFLRFLFLFLLFTTLRRCNSLTYLNQSCSITADSNKSLNYSLYWTCFIYLISPHLVFKKYILCI